MDTAKPMQDRPATEHHHAPGRAAPPRRRPSGEPPPLPHQLGRTGKFWLIMVGYFVVTTIGVLTFPSFARFFERWDTQRLRWVASLRTPWLTHVMVGVNWLTTRWTIRLLRWSALAVLIAFRRWRHLIVLVGALLVLEIIAEQMSVLIDRPRPLGVTILAPWNGFSLPSRPVAGLAVTLVGMAYALIVPGRHRYQAKWAIGTVLGVVCLARIYLAVDQPSSAAFAAILGVAVGITAFRWFTPNDLFPVSYQRAKAAHLDVGGRRGEAIVRGVKDQLGLDVLEIKPVGLEGSGGSTPLRLQIAATDDEPEGYLFAKLYAKSHVRADRWYKLGRTVLYGALEDETPFKTVRRFVEYEDYTLRLMYDQGLPAPIPYGIVEITPEREYMIVMQFFEDAVEIGEAEVSDHVVDQGLQLVRHMWDLGLAHRDVKPANLMVQRGELRLIDVFFVQVRPSPWRQAVDLANMMMVLALRTDAPRVYEQALRYFTPDEIAEAFAATRGVASPTQLRSMMKAEGRDLLAEFRTLAPDRPAVRIQRWSIRRVALTVWVVFAGFFVIVLAVNNWALFA
jgi:tRNA A-37 threonylcarbamoyl transferase component Bud32